MSTGTALNPIYNPPSHKPLSHLSDNGMLEYIDRITKCFHDMATSANTQEQIRAMTEVRRRLEWVQTRLGIYEDALAFGNYNGLELKDHLNNLMDRTPKITTEGIPPEMFIVEQATVGCPYVRRFINFDWIEWFLATRRNVTPSDAYNEAKQALNKTLFRSNWPMDVTINVIEGTRHPEIIVERTQKVRI